MVATKDFTVKVSFLNLENRSPKISKAYVENMISEARYLDFPVLDVRKYGRSYGFAIVQSNSPGPEGGITVWVVTCIPMRHRSLAASFVTVENMEDFKHLIDGLERNFHAGLESDLRNLSYLNEERRHCSIEEFEKMIVKAKKCVREEIDNFLNKSLL